MKGDRGRSSHSPYWADSTTTTAESPDGHLPSETITDEESSRHSGEELKNREVMLAILEEIKARKIAAIIVPNFTRLSRDEDIIDGLIIKKTCRDFRVVVIDFNGKVYDFQNDNDQDAAFLEFWFASRDKRQMMSNMMRGAMERAMQGEYMGGAPPLGYKIVHSGKVNKRGKALYKRVIDEKEAELVKKIFRLYREKSGTATARTLNVEGIKYPPRHKAMREKGSSEETAKPLAPRTFSGTDVMRIVKNPLYAGWVRWGTGLHRDRTRSKYLKDFAPQMNFDPSLQVISQKEFDEVQKLVKDRGMVPPRSANSYYPFAYILKCRYCGGGLTGNAIYKTRKFKRDVPIHMRHMYGCKAHYINPKACPRVNYINARLVAYAVIPFVASVIRDKARLMEALGQAASEYSKNETLQALEADTRAELSKTEQGLERIMDAIAEGLISNQEAKAKLDELREKKERLTRDIVDFEGKAQIQAEILEAISYLNDDLEDVLWRLFEIKPNVLGRILRMIFKKHSVLVQAYGAMEKRMGRIVHYELQEEFKQFEVASDSADDNGLSKAGVLTQSNARAC